MQANRPVNTGFFTTRGRPMPTPPKSRPLSGSNAKPQGGPSVKPVKPGSRSK